MFSIGHVQRHVTVSANYLHLPEPLEKLTLRLAGSSTEVHDITQNVNERGHFDVVLLCRDDPLLTIPIPTRKFEIKDDVARIELWRDEELIKQWTVSDLVERWSLGSAGLCA